MLVWDDQTNNYGLHSGVMNTHDQDTLNYFKGTAVTCVLCPRQGSEEDSYLHVSTVWYSTVHCSTVWGCTVQYSTVHCSAVQHSAAEGSHGYSRQCMCASATHMVCSRRKWTWIPSCWILKLKKNCIVFNT
jgi:hypothetical protein